MKYRLLIFAICLATVAFAQHTLLPHGMVFGTKPVVAEVVQATKLEAFMDKKARISATIRGRVLSVTKQKGGWFTIDGGNGKIIAAHFKNYNITIPIGLKGKTIIAEGVAAKQFLADDLQHFAGDTVSGKKQHQVKTNPKHRLDFEVKGLMVDH
ncbi:DUF4920 domain-containing protein [Mucilaginibacter sp. dw_454]|uniref:DUF4920 domain-containing protein n=1 Tax=Mucilaginibacter sp. dw_454 TaxID=2720079 RepID=UPI001BD459E4|nr:DUF4920 domain-containing protein [Mucilaginibacter sp. dw_454]